MLTGDPTKFGLEECKMNEEGQFIFIILCIRIWNSPKSHIRSRITFILSNYRFN